MEFKAFPKIEQIGKAGDMHITQKIHGSNACVVIYEVDTSGISTKVLFCQSRNRIITPEDDNYGFATFVYANKEEFFDKLGVGYHYGEWAGPGINSGEGLTQKTFVLFDHWKFPPERPLPSGCAVVPVLYHGKMDLDQVNLCMEDLKNNGSKLVPGFLSVEGVVVSLAGTRYKKVFQAEETQWKKEGSRQKKLTREKQTSLDVSHLFQPVRLEKLLSRDSKYIETYPESLPLICKDYVQDLMDEGQIVGTEDEIKAIRKAMGGDLFKFVKEHVKL
jgi:hypothetical protein